MVFGVLQLFLASFLPAPVLGSFDTVWKCPAGGPTGCTLRLPLISPASGGNYSFLVTWGDGSPSETVSGAQASNTITHIYLADGPHNVTMTGQIDGFRFNNVGTKSALVAVTDWGEVNLGNAAPGRYFYGCSELVSLPAVAPPGVTDYNRMFHSCTKLTGANMANWDVSEVTVMTQMFFNTMAFIGTIGLWDVSKVLIMNTMFSSSSFNGNIDGWDVSKVTSMWNMFQNNAVFNGSLGAWDTSEVITTSGMFWSASSFNGNIEGWNTAKVTHMGYMFNSASTFNRDLSSWDVCRVGSYDFFNNALGASLKPSFGTTSCAPTTPPTTSAPTAATSTPTLALPKSVLILEAGALLIIKASSTVHVGF